MKDDIKRFRLIDKLKISGVPDIVIYDYVYDFENELNNEYEILMSKNEFRKAVRKMAWSFILPYSLNDKYSIITKALHTLEYINESSGEIYNLDEIKDDRFENFRLIMEKEWKVHLWKNKKEKFNLLDSEDNLLDKKFDELLEILNDKESPNKNDNLSIINEIRIQREKYASELLSVYFSKSKEYLNPRNNNETDKESLKEELINLEKQILQYSSGRYCKYAQNQMNYYANIKEMTDNENLQIEISEQTEKISSNKNDYLKFENEINSDKITLKDKIRIIVWVFEEAIVNNSIEGNIKIIENWAEKMLNDNDKIINQIENDTREMPDKKSYIKEIIELIDSYNKILPDAIKLKLHHKLTDIIKQDNNEFIDNTKQEDIPITVEKEPDISIKRGFLQWIKYFIKKIFRK